MSKLLHYIFSNRAESLVRLFRLFSTQKRYIVLAILSLYQVAIPNCKLIKISQFRLSQYWKFIIHNSDFISCEVYIWRFDSLSKRLNKTFFNKIITAFCLNILTLFLTIPSLYLTILSYFSQFISQNYKFRAT